MGVHIKRVHAILSAAIFVFFVGLSPAWCESKAETKIEDKFKVRWTSIDYTKRVSLRNSEVSDRQRQEISESVSLSCEVEILDPNFVLGISQEPIIEEMMDDKGENVEIESRPRNSFQMRYEPARYERRFAAPARPAKWKTAVRSALGLSQSESSRPKWIEQVRPYRIRIDIGMGKGEESGQKISHIKGYFHALIAESFEYVDVPFEKSDKWIRLTPDVEVQISDAFTDESSFRLNTKARPQGGGGLRDSLSPDSYLPERILVERRLIGPDGKAVNRRTGISRLPFRPSGNSSGGGSSMGRIKKIRYVIAVNPKHYEIPFVLENIPLPKP